MSEEAVMIRQNLLFAQACVPADWTDDQVEEWAPPSGTTHGWGVREVGETFLGEEYKGPKRVPCLERKGFVHIMLVC